MLIKKWLLTTSVCSDTDFSEIKDYELKVEGSPSSSSMASDEEDTHRVYAVDPLVDKEWLELYKHD